MAGGGWGGRGVWGGGCGGLGCGGVGVGGGEGERSTLSVAIKTDVTGVCTSAGERGKQSGTRPISDLPLLAQLFAERPSAAPQALPSLS